MTFPPIMLRRLAAVALASLLSACHAGTGPADPSAEYGSEPELQAANQSLLPTVKLAKAVGWPKDRAPSAMQDLRVTSFATGLSYPRWLLALPNGDLLVAESNRPAKGFGISGIKGWFAKRTMAYTGAGGASADRISLLRDTDNDGIADFKTIYLDNLSSPFGMVLVDDTLYIANTDAVVAVPYRTGDTAAPARPQRIAPLPAGPLNHHWTKGLIAGSEPGTLLVSVGSNSNIGENGLDNEHLRAGILRVDIASGQITSFAAGLRNPVGMARDSSGKLWTVVNERDELGDQLVPDYLTAVAEGDHFGWPWTYWGDIPDPRVPATDGAPTTARIPDYALGAHTASLGLAFYEQTAIPALQGTALIGQHGSWNRSEAVGYKVIAVPFSDGKPSGQPFDVLTGFLSDRGEAFGRPAGVAVGADGAVLVADDAGNTVWRIAPP